MGRGGILDLGCSTDQRDKEVAVPGCFPWNCTGTPQVPLRSLPPSYCSLQIPYPTTGVIFYISSRGVWDKRCARVLLDRLWV